MNPAGAWPPEAMLGFSLVVLAAVKCAPGWAPEFSAERGVRCRNQAGALKCPESQLPSSRVRCENGLASETHTCPEDGLTSSGHRDGFGAQLGAMLAVAYQARLLRRTFCHTPWVSIDHASKSKLYRKDFRDASNPCGALRGREAEACQMQRYSRRLFDYIGGSFYGPPANNGTTRVMSLPGGGCTNRSMFFYKASTDIGMHNPRRRDPNFKFAHFPRLTYDGGILESLRREARLTFLTGASNSPLIARPKTNDAAEIKFVFHARRGDVGKSGISKRYSRDDDIVKCIENVVRSPALKALAGRPLRRVEILSEGNESSFRGVAAALGGTVSVVPILNEDLEPTFHRMVLADVFVVAASSLSHTAAFMNDGIQFAPRGVSEWRGSPIYGDYRCDKRKSRGARAFLSC